ncbi:alpha/beta hydrolase [Novosphingobium flavum]|uniref:Alpha/beta hydrolase n=1 Tax=Novosphingobium aerophilum TaxID=2839843 RepID=A0A7X1F6A2_9SPHN|nr:alpha/beta hydrolase [Novosphingobium aerophilum]MBC2651165.1 alpha/beta hydrolase [Novosphingobium aerophilum]MBC2660722.1 alpha/beta hydrolase [Novosphingobium aerophilum]
MTNFVLVHGAWGGGWAYDRLFADLRARGHEVVVAALTGLGTRAAELNPAISLSTHIDDVCAQAEAAGFDRFVLVGHSYGGMVITGTATRLGARIDALIYLDAFLPEDGQSIWDLTEAWEHEHYIGSQKDMPGLVPPLPGIEHPLLGRHPLLTFLEPVRFTGEEARVKRRCYVFATGWQPTPFTRFAEHVQGNPAWEYHEAAAGHDVMGDQPEQTLALLLSCC